MKKLLILIVLALPFACLSQNRWNIYAGGSISHLCETPWVSSDKSYGWGGGAFIGGGLEINFTPNWSLTPQLDLCYVNNGATLSSAEMGFYANHANWLETWNLQIPVIASFRFAVNESVKLRIGAGPYFQTTFAGRHYKYDSDQKESIHGSIADRINVGAAGELAVEPGNHFSYFFRTQYPFLNEGLVRKTITLSFGVKYHF